VAEVALTREPHHLPGLAVDRQRDAAGKAAARVEADRARLHVGRGRLAREQLLGGILRIVGLGERRQRLRIDRALVLRVRAAESISTAMRRAVATARVMAPSYGGRFIFQARATRTRVSWLK
jgi:hypothetical protein